MLTHVDPASEYWTDNKKLCYCGPDHLVRLSDRFDEIIINYGRNDLILKYSNQHVSRLRQRVVEDLYVEKYIAHQVRDLDTCVNAVVNRLITRDSVFDIFMFRALSLEDKRIIKKLYDTANINVVRRIVTDNHAWPSYRDDAECDDMRRFIKVASTEYPKISKLLLKSLCLFHHYGENILISRRVHRIDKLTKQEILRYTRHVLCETKNIGKWLPALNY